MSMIDKQYAKDVTEEIGHLRNFKSITEFINAFCKHVQKQGEYDINIKTMCITTLKCQLYHQDHYHAKEVYGSRADHSTEQ